MKRNLLFIIAVSICALSYGQGEIDAYHYSSSDLSGTARGQAMGGAFGALGGDVTGVAINPAGIAIYRSSEVVANMSLTFPASNFLDSKTKFSFDNISYIYYYPLFKSSNMLSLNFGFNYNRVKDFNHRYNVSGGKKDWSLTDKMEILSNGIEERLFANDPFNNARIPWLSTLAWRGGLIRLKPESNNSYETILNKGEKVTPSLSVWERGKIEVYDFTVGGNVSNTFFWGASLSIADLSYRVTSTYSESFDDGGSFNLDNYLETKGSGFQMKLGFIYRPVDALRIGLSYHSPIWYTMTDYYGATLTSRDIIEDQKSERIETPNGRFGYNFQTPGCFTVSVAAILGTKAIVSVDYENKDYSFMRFSSAGTNSQSEWTDQNKYIKEDYKSTSMVRAGLEYRFTPQFSGRVGYAWAQNPYSSSIGEIGERIETVGTIPHYSLSNCTSYMTAGLGYRFTPQFYCDLAVVVRTQDDSVYYFSPNLDGKNIADSYVGTFTNKTIKTLLTLGYRF